ncbi:MAG: protein kinase, partial [Verrucomicrobiota bacterium]
MTDEEPEAPTAGAWRFGDYEIINPIARGGMGTVYCARQVSLNRTVALKIISAADAAAPDFLERFRTEAEVAASLHHPHIVSVYDFGEHEGQYFLTMQF